MIIYPDQPTVLHLLSRTALVNETLLPLLVFILVVVALARSSVCFSCCETESIPNRRDAAIEKLNSKETELALSAAELAGLKEALATSQSELTKSKEELAGLHARSELERDQFEEKLAFIERSKEQLGESFKNMANDLLEAKVKALARAVRKISRRCCRRFRKK